MVLYYELVLTSKAYMRYVFLYPFGNIRSNPLSQASNGDQAAVVIRTRPALLQVSE